MEDYKTMQGEIETLKKDISELRTGEDALKSLAEASSTPVTRLGAKLRRNLKGHFGKIYAVQWSQSDPQHLVSASQDGKLLIWNAFSTNKNMAIPLSSCWVMTCAYAPSGKYVACGGLDNTCSIYKVDLKAEVGVSKENPMVELAQHEGYLSCCRFLDDRNIVTSSGDSTILLWDVNENSIVSTFAQHSGDVMSIAVNQEKGLIVSGSVDATAKLWDYRDSKKCIGTFSGHESDINAVDFFPDGNAFVTGSDDSSLRLFDIRSMRCLNVYASETLLCGITSARFSKSGKLLFAGYDDFMCHVWDTVTGKQAQQLEGHEDRVSCLDVSADGQALATGSWDTILKIWA